MQTGEAKHCDTCGHWDSALVEGMCEECRNRYRVISAGHGGACCGGCSGQCARADRQAEEVIA